MATISVDDNGAHHLTNHEQGLHLIFYLLSREYYKLCVILSSHFPVKEPSPCSEISTARSVAESDREPFLLQKIGKDCMSCP